MSIYHQASVFSGSRMSRYGGASRPPHESIPHRWSSELSVARKLWGSAVVNRKDDIRRERRPTPSRYNSVMIRIKVFLIQPTLSRVYRVLRVGGFPRRIHHVVRICVIRGWVRRRRRIAKARCGRVFYVPLVFLVEWPHVVVRESMGLDLVKTPTKLSRESKDQDIKYRKYDCGNKRCSVWRV